VNCPAERWRVASTLTAASACASVKESEHGTRRKLYEGRKWRERKIVKKAKKDEFSQGMSLGELCHLLCSVRFVDSLQIHE
jgi:hypothetical protein